MFQNGAFGAVSGRFAPKNLASLPPPSGRNLAILTLPLGEKRKMRTPRKVVGDPLVLARGLGANLVRILSAKSQKTEPFAPLKNFCVFQKIIS